MEIDSLFSRPSRGLECIVGIVAALLGIALLLFVGLGIFRLFGGPPPAGFIVILFVCSALGALLSSAGAVSQSRVAKMEAGERGPPTR